MYFSTVERENFESSTTSEIQRLIALKVWSNDHSHYLDLNGLSLYGAEPFEVRYQKTER